MELIDTHCHIQFDDYGLEAEQAVSNAKQSGVSKMIAVGCTIKSSQQAVDMASRESSIWASVGLHPHESDEYSVDKSVMSQLSDLVASNKVVAVGEIGLDYYYMNSSKKNQKLMFSRQLELAVRYNLPVIFHVRDAFSDFWTIFDDFNDKKHPIRGVIHSFSSGMADLEAILARNLYIGLNGIMTFTKHSGQLEAAKNVPLDKLVLETDAPFLTPKPFRGTINEPKNVRLTAEFLADLRDEAFETLAGATTLSAQELFGI